MTPSRIILLSAVLLSAIAVALAGVIAMQGPQDQCSTPSAEMTRGWKCDAVLTSFTQP